MNKIFIEPTYPVFDNNELFNLASPLNRDNCLAPFNRFKDEMREANITVHTYDRSYDFSDIEDSGYISLGSLRSVEEAKSRGLKLLAFYIMEPPLVMPEPYEKMAYLTENFEKVFVHNVVGDSYDLAGVNLAKLVKYYVPQPYTSILPEYWENTKRTLGVIVINGHHRPRRLFERELYSKRIEWAVGLTPFISVVLYGRGWNKIYSKANLWKPYLKNFFSIRQIYQGPCDSKFKLYSQYDFALCFENQIMNGYITEKIFDCFYAGVIPIYWGGHDVQELIPSECYIDMRMFRNPRSLATYLLEMKDEEKQLFRESGRKFLESKEAQKYYSISKSLFLTSKNDE